MHLIASIYGSLECLYFDRHCIYLELKIKVTTPNLVLYVHFLNGQDKSRFSLRNQFLWFLDLKILILLDRCHFSTLNFHLCEAIKVTYRTSDKWTIEIVIFHNVRVLSQLIWTHWN